MGRKKKTIDPLPSVRVVSSYALGQLKELQAELSDRRIEALKLYSPTETQSEIHACKASEILVIGGNRSGKSLCTFVEDARCVTGQDPHHKYPERDGILVIVGKDWKHIGMTVYPYLFKAGAFKIIRDTQTNQWRAFNPTTDAGRERDAKPAPPLIPPRMIKKKSWIDKANQQIQGCELSSGWQIYFCSSEGDPPQGFKADRVHIDEDISNERWVEEMQARLSDNKGKMAWSAMPHSKNDALLGLKERAESDHERAKESPDIVMFKLRFLDNPHIDSDEKRKRIEGWAALGQDVLRMRSEGDFVTDSILVYPTFSMSVHGYDRSDLPGLVVPRDWCQYLVVDPGHVVTAVLFAAVPPDSDMMLIYDELYIRQCNAVIFGEQLERKTQGQAFHAFLIDMHGGKIRDIGSGRQPVELYSEQLRNRQIRSETTGNSFLAACDDVQARLASTQSYMHIRPDGTTKLRVLRGATPNLEREMRRYKKKTNYVAGMHVVTDTPNTRGEVHACQCLEYLCAYGPKYHKPKENIKPERWYADYERRRRFRLRQAGSDGAFVFLGPRSGDPHVN